MSESIEHNIGDHEDPLPGPTWIIGFLSVVLLAVIVLGLTAIYYSARAEELEVKVVSAPLLELETLRTAQLALIEGNPKWLESEIIEGAGETETRKTVKTLAIPVDQAIKAYVAEAPAKTSR